MRQIREGSDHPKRRAKDEEGREGRRGDDAQWMAHEAEERTAVEGREHGKVVGAVSKRRVGATRLPRSKSTDYRSRSTPTVTDLDRREPTMRNSKEPTSTTRWERLQSGVRSAGPQAKGESRDCGERPGPPGQ